MKTRPLLSFPQQDAALTQQKHPAPLSHFPTSPSAFFPPHNRSFSPQSFRPSSRVNADQLHVLFLEPKEQSKCLAEKESQLAARPVPRHQRERVRNRIAQRLVCRSVNTVEDHRDLRSCIRASRCRVSTMVTWTTNIVKAVIMPTSAVDLASPWLAFWTFLTA